MTTVNPYLSKDGRLENIIRPEEIIIFGPTTNSHGKRDVTGAFRPEAKLFRKFHKIPDERYYEIDNQQHRYQMTKDVFDILEQEHHLGIYVFFCHGYTHGIQLGFRSPGHRWASDTDKENFEKLCRFAADRHPCPIFVLYACSTGDDPDGDPDTAPGSGDGSFADTMRDRLSELGADGCRIFSHSTAGHTTANPFIKIFDGSPNPQDRVGGKLFMDPHNLSDFRSFRVRLKSRQGNFEQYRYRIPFIK